MNNNDLLKFGKCLLIGIIVAIGGMFFSDLYGNIFNGSGGLSFIRYIWYRSVSLHRYCYLHRLDT